jgi:hypothetical protein
VFLFQERLRFSCEVVECKPLPPGAGGAAADWRGFVRGVLVERGTHGDNVSAEDLAGAPFSPSEVRRYRLTPTKPMFTAF